MVDRRDDVGTKVMTGALSGIILLLVTLFINATWTTANEGKDKAYEVGERLIATSTKLDLMQSDISEIKALLKRAIPIQQTMGG